MFAKWYEVNGIKCQGLIEVRMVTKLFESSINFSRGKAIKTPFGNYTPDFDCGDYFVEVKCSHSWFKALGQLSMLDNAKNEAMAIKENSSQLKMEWVNKNVKPIYVWVSVGDVSKDKYLNKIIEVPHDLERFIGTADDFIPWVYKTFNKRKETESWGFPDCGDCESTPCRCERDDSWF